MTDFYQTGVIATLHRLKPGYFEHLEETFAKPLRLAADSFSQDPLGTPLIPNWNRITAAMPDFLERLKDAVDLDTSESFELLTSNFLFF